MNKMDLAKWNYSTIALRRLPEKKTIILVVISLAGLFLRVHGLGRESLWFDEGFTLYVARQNVARIFFAPLDVPPLFYIMLHFWIRLFGNSEVSVRFPSVVFSVLSIFMTYKIAKKLFDTEVGLISAALSALSLFYVQYAQEARTYSLTVLLTLASMYYFLETYDKKTYSGLLGYIVFSTLLLYSHIYGFFIIISQNIYFFVMTLTSDEEDRKEKMKRWFFVQATICALFSPWVPILLGQIAANEKIFWILKPNRWTLIETFLTYSWHNQYLFLLFALLIPLSFITYERISGQLSWNSFFQSMENIRCKVGLSQTTQIFFLFTWLSIPIALPFAISRYSAPIYLIKYTIIACPAFFLFVAAGLGNIANRRMRLIVQMTMLALLLGFAVPAFSHYYRGPQKDQWREAAHFIDTHAAKADLILFNSPVCRDFVFDYYSKRRDLVERGFPASAYDTDIIREGYPHKFSQVNRSNINELAPLTQPYKRVWVVLAYSPDKNNYNLITTRLRDNYDLVNHEQFRNIDIYLFQKQMR
jgi:mannosyltransferase